MTLATQQVEHTGVAARPRGVRRATWSIWLTRLVIVILCVLVLLPTLWVLSASVEVGSSAFSSTLWPSSFTWANYNAIFNQGFWTWARNSIIICTLSGVIQLVINALAAYAFSRLSFRGKRGGLLALVLIQLFPNLLAISAIYTLLVSLNLLDTLQGIIMVYIGGSAFNIWLIKNYMDSLPRELDESAVVDGANAWQIFWKVLLPLMRPMLVTMFIFGFTGTYNDFIFASLILQTQDHYTVTVGLYNIINNSFATNWAMFAAGAVLASTPILIIYLALQRQLVSGLAQGAVKG